MKETTRETLRGWGEVLGCLLVVFVLAGGYVMNGCGTELPTCGPSTPAETACIAPRSP